GEKDDATRVPRETLDDGGSGRRRGGPHEESRAYTLECGVERFGHGEVARHPAAAGRRVSARTGTPAPRSWATTARPTRPVAPVTRTGLKGARYDCLEAQQIHCP